MALAMLAGGCPGDDGGNGDGTTNPTGTTSEPTTGEVLTTDGPGTTDPEPSTGPSTLDDSGTEGTDTGIGTDTDEPTTGEPPETCGNGAPDPGEDCDDGNGTDADGCNTDCTISGSVQWFHTQASGFGQVDEAFGVAVDAQGRPYVVGEIFNGSNLDHWLRQYEEDDGVGWTTTVDGGGGNDGARGVVLRGNNLYTAGYRVVPGLSNNVWLRSFGTDGSVGLAAEFDDGLGGSNVGQGIAADPGGNLVVVGEQTVEPLAPHVDAWIREYTAAGSPVWTAGYGGGGADHARAVATDATGRVAVAGYETVGGQADIWLRVYDTNGGVQWTVSHANVNNLEDDARGVAFDADGNVIVVGWELDPVLPYRLWIGKYDPTGVPLWSQSWDGETLEGARAFGVATDDTGDIVIVGQHRSAGFNEFLVRKLGPDGTPKWTTRIAGFPGTDQVGRAVAIGPGRRVWVAGSLDQGVDGRDIYVARLAP